jgi:hypothetical protein
LNDGLGSSYRELTGEDVRELLGELLDRLAARGVEVEAYIVGGAAMALHLGREQLTPDIDGIFKPQAEVFAEAATMAGEYGLDPKWVNSAFLSYMSFSPKDDGEPTVVELRGHKVTIASKRVLLAMKIAASRSKDHTDTSRLILDLGITDANELVDLAFSLFGEGNMTLSEDREEVTLIVEEALRRAERYGAGIRSAGVTRPVPAGTLIASRTTTPSGRCGKPRANGRGFCMRRVGEQGCPYHG